MFESAEEEMDLFPVAFGEDDDDDEGSEYVDEDDEDAEDDDYDEHDHGEHHAYIDGMLIRHLLLHIPALLMLTGIFNLQLVACEWRSHSNQRMAKMTRLPAGLRGTSLRSSI